MQSSKEDESNKKRKAVDISVSIGHGEDGGAVFERNPYILNLSLQYLDPKSVARCKQVCKNWKNSITPLTWKRVAENLNPDSFRAVCEAVGRNGSNNMSYESLAIGLGDLLVESNQQTEPDPSILGKDIHILVELSSSDSGETGSWCLSYDNSNYYHFIKEGRSIMTFPLKEDHDNYYAAIDDLSETMTVSLSLWRMDTNQFFTICRTVGFHTDSPEIGLISHCAFLRPDANSAAGKNARRIFQEKGYNVLAPDVSLLFENDQVFDGAEVADSDEEDVSSISQLVLSKLAVQFYVHLEDSYTSFWDLDEQELLLFLEGLDWK